MGAEVQDAAPKLSELWPEAAATCRGPAAARVAGEDSEHHIVGW